MEKVLVEFINTWPSCDEYGKHIQRVASKFENDVEVKLYQAGKDFSYVKKYGMVTKGTLIINKKKKYDRLSKDVIEKIISEAVESK